MIVMTIFSSNKWTERIKIGLIIQRKNGRYDHFQFKLKRNLKSSSLNAWLDKCLEFLCPNFFLRPSDSSKWNFLSSPNRERLTPLVIMGAQLTAFRHQHALLMFKGFQEALYCPPPDADKRQPLGWLSGIGYSSNSREVDSMHNIW